MSKPIDMTGRKFGKLLVLEEAYRKKNVHWKCLCDCGTETIVIGSGLRNGHTISCGCAKTDGAIKTAKKMLAVDPRLASARHVYTNEYKDGDLTFEQFLDISQKPCYYCGIAPENSNMYNKYVKKQATTVLIDIRSGDFFYNGLDRTDNLKTHNLDNVAPCCKWCNTAKMHRTVEEFIAWLERAYQHHKNRNGN